VKKNAFDSGLLDKQEDDVAHFLKGELSRIRGMEKQMSRMNYSASEINEWRENELLKVKLQYFQKNEERRLVAQDKLVRLAKKWQEERDRNPTKSLLDLERLKMRYQVMNRQQVSAEMQDYILKVKAGELPGWQAERVELLLSRAQELNAGQTTYKDGPNKGKTEEAIFRDCMNESHYSEPWRAIPEAREIQKVIDFHSVPFGSVRVLMKGDNQEGQPVEVNRQTILEDLY
jgi:hypothetical protein